MFPFQYQFMFKKTWGIYYLSQFNALKKKTKSNLLFLLANLKQTILHTQVPYLVSKYRFDPQINNPTVQPLTAATTASETNFIHLYLNILPLNTVKI